MVIFLPSIISPGGWKDEVPVPLRRTIGRFLRRFRLCRLFPAFEAVAGLITPATFPQPSSHPQLQLNLI
jgi:hypothetical protein